jgi:hypothetical protein
MIRQPHGTVRARRPLDLLTFPGSLCQPVISMKTLVAGATGALGRRLVPF